MSTSESYLTVLQQKLAQVSASWTVDDFNAFVTFYSSLLPSLFEVERCSVFIMELGSKEICSIHGTGLEKTQIKPPLKGSIVGEVIDSGKSFLVNDLQNHRTYPFKCVSEFSDSPTS